MASYQNTSEYYCGVTMDSYPEHCTNPNVYFEQNPSNFQMHDVVYSPENYMNQAAPMLSSGANICEARQVVHDNSHYYVNPACQYHQLQYTKFTREPVLYPGIHLEPRPLQSNHYMAKKHRAQITIVPSSKGNFKAVIKRKRKRTIFSTEQIEGLEEIFKKQQYVSREERQLIVKNLKIHDKAVKIWFQNRRLKTKRLQDQDSEEQEHSEESSSSPDVTRLNSVESEIRKNTDENGFVTLDDGIMGQLANVIDSILTKSNVHVPDNNIVANDTPTLPTYEPISPADVHANNEEENSICWRPSEPSESLQTLFDLKSMKLL